MRDLRELDSDIEITDDPMGGGDDLSNAGSTQDDGD
jgi:hypothetical protein